MKMLLAVDGSDGSMQAVQHVLALARDDDGGDRNDRAIDIAVLRLRRAIEVDPKQPRWIQTVWGIGYRFSP